MELDAKMMAAIFAVVASMAGAVKVLYSQLMSSRDRTASVQDGYIEEVKEDRNRYREELLPAIENVTETLRALKDTRVEDRQVYLDKIAPAISELQTAVRDLKEEVRRRDG